MNQPKEPMPFKVWCEMQAERIRKEIQEYQNEIEHWKQLSKKYPFNPSIPECINDIEFELMEWEIRLSYYEQKLNELKEREKQEKKGKKNSKKRE